MQLVLKNLRHYRVLLLYTFHTIVPSKVTRRYSHNSIRLIQTVQIYFFVPYENVQVQVQVQGNYKFFTVYFFLRISPIIRYLGGGGTAGIAPAILLPCPPPMPPPLPFTNTPLQLV